MSVRFRKALIDDVRYEAASVFDVNNDGALDIVCGEYWYEGPDWVKHKICDVQQEGEYYDDFSDLPMDVNGDGYIDIVTGGWFGEVLRWRENPGGKSPENWRVHDIARCGNIETTRLFDVDGDGELEIVPNTPGTRQAWYKLVRDADGKGTGRFEKHVIAASPEPSGHGLGFGDVNGDGRKDIVLCSGWLEAPEDRVNGKWTFHNEFDLRAASIEILVYDVNGDGLTDLWTGGNRGATGPATGRGHATRSIPAPRSTTTCNWRTSTGTVNPRLSPANDIAHITATIPARTIPPASTTSSLGMARSRST